jgi:hypothetical protein
MATFKKQFPTFRVLCITPEEEVTPENFDKCYYEIDGTGGSTVLHPDELSFPLVEQLISDDITQVLWALENILDHRKSLANSLESILESKLESSQE